MTDIKKQLNFHFKIKELELIKRVLNIRIERFRSRRKIYLNQQVYIEKFLYKYLMKNSITKDTTISIVNINNLYRLRKDKKLGKIRDYQKKINSTMFFIIYTRLDIFFIISKLSQYMNDSNVYHETVTKHHLRYLRSIKKLRICYRTRSITV